MKQKFKYMMILIAIFDVKFKDNWSTSTSRSSYCIL